jgi:hypothetical protein
MGALLMVHLSSVAMAASLGVWLFYVQHQFEETHWSRQGRWQRDEAALHGSSYYDLPTPLRWLTANIGVHHVHHVDSRIPFYRLGEVLKERPELKTIGRITVGDSLRCMKLALWDEATIGWCPSVRLTAWSPSTRALSHLSRALAEPAAGFGKSPAACAEIGVEHGPDVDHLRHRPPAAPRRRPGRRLRQLQRVREQRLVAAAQDVDRARPVRSPWMGEASGSRAEAPPR